MLSDGNLKEYQHIIWETAKDFNSFLVTVLSEHNKAFAFFIPHRFEKTTWEITANQLLFYWINED